MTTRDKIAKTIVAETGVSELQALTAARKVLEATERPSLFMQNAGWREAESQGIDPETIDVASIFRAMIQAAKDGK